MTPTPAQRNPAKVLAWGNFPQGAPSLLKDLPIFLAAFSVFYAFLAVTRYWLTPVSSQTQIDVRPSALPVYAMFSVVRIAISYVISLVFSIGYGLQPQGNQQL
jgi:NitT/TauT family transport system permease protein